MNHHSEPSAPARVPGRNDPCWCGGGRKFKHCHYPQANPDGGAPRSPRPPVLPGTVGPRRPVPPGIELPPYALGASPKNGPAREIHPPERIERLRRTGQAAAEVLALLGAALRPGMTTDELDALAHAATLARHAYPSPLGYRGFPKSICTSVNEVICHGIPDSRKLQSGDIINLDVTLYREGVHGDLSATYPVGKIDDVAARLLRVTRECLERGIAEVRPGAPVRAIGRAISAHAEAAGFGVVRAYCGHGIGETFHTGLQIPHHDEPTARQLLEPGMVFTIEPMITEGAWRHRQWDDGWTAVTIDGLRTAQFEHTVLVTATGVEILTVLTPDAGAPAR